MLYRLLFRTLMRRVVPFWALSFIVCAIFWRSIDTPGLMTALESSSLGVQAAWLLAVWVVVALVVRGHARAALYGDRLRPMWRAPISRWRWSLLVAPYTVAIGLPVCVLGLLWPLPAWASTVGLASVTHPLVLSVGGAGLGAAVWALVSMIYGLIVFAAISVAPWSHWAAIGFLPGGWVLGAYVYDDLRGRMLGPPRPWSWLRPRTRWVSLIVYDARTLIRGAGGFWVTGHVLALLASGLVFAVGRHDGPVGGLTVVLSGALSMWSVRAVTRVRLHQGASFMPARWPVRVHERTAALMIVASAPIFGLVAIAGTIASGWSLERIVLVAAMLLVWSTGPTAFVLSVRSQRAVDAWPIFVIAGSWLCLLPAIAVVPVAGLAALFLWRAGTRALEAAREAAR